MNFVDLQPTVKSLIAGHATFSVDAATTVCMDLGNKKTFTETALDTVNGGKGYVIGVWPPARGQSTASDFSGIDGVEAMIIVRFQVSPVLLATMSDEDAAAWVNNRIKDIFGAVLGGALEPNGTRFQLATDCFELVNFDEGLIAYHLRFSRFAVF